MMFKNFENKNVKYKYVNLNDKLKIYILKKYEQKHKDKDALERIWKIFNFQTSSLEYGLSPLSYTYRPLGTEKRFEEFNLKWEAYIYYKPYINNLNEMEHIPGSEL
ncbi:hypothetical protein PFLG_02818 [Plasmodium falciparum RAJ116]|uniref:Uncharacterized protein n=1 Tax=Plasmodium falciparum RAJ116 TaxID=580058 RepID=A0A0L0CZV9_PLAFA|nr:hypothetical protein PFLG_02818 [Plasmodium falciparum RAJ116]